MVFTVCPIIRSTSSAMSTETGMVSSEMTVVRAFIRKMTNTTTTKSPPS